MFKTIFLWVLYWISWAILSLRYKVKIQGLDALHEKALTRKGGILFLPNHPAEIDPIIIFLVLWPKFRPRPLVVEHFFYLKLGHGLMKFLGCLPIPDMSGSVNRWKQKQVEKIFTYISTKIVKDKENFIIYPAGRLRSSDLESLGGASFVPNLLKAEPEINPVLIRTTGLWGSRFSKAFSPSNPDFFGVVLRGIKAVLLNGIFFMPRRTVSVELQLAPADFPYQGSRLEMNQYLEAWYNQKGPEPLYLVSDYCWKKSFPEVLSPAAKGEKVAFKPLAEEEREAIFGKVADLAKIPIENVKIESHLARDLGLDSLDISQIFVFLDQRYHLSGVSQTEFETVEDLLRVASEEKAEKRELEGHEKEKTVFPKESNRPGCEPPSGKTVQECFLRVCERMGPFSACADETSGVISYRRLKFLALLLMNKFKDLEGDKVGVLFPSSFAGYLVTLALLLAKKTPVMLNWTAGVRSLNHAVKVTELKKVISSRKFLNQLTGVDLGDIDDQLVFMEDVKTSFSLLDKWKGFLLYKKSPERLLKKLQLTQVSEDDPTVILFTSGTESLPKGVPLSHRNILENQKAALSCVSFDNQSVIYSVLPPFHSFGFSVTGLFPILVGMSAYFSPDPTDGQRMAREIEKSQATLFCAAPTFIRNLFQLANPSQLRSLRYVVAGAEKTPQEIFDYVDHLGTGCQVMEGYGITECSPMVSLTRPSIPRQGVGQLLPNVEVCTIHPETAEELEKGAEGEICISGPNVFAGYLGEIGRNPFIEIRGRKWYRSGDRGYVDERGFLYLSGRLKRFAKIGGEMVSLGGLEEEVLQLSAEKQWLDPSLKKEGPPLAISLVEDVDKKPMLVLFTIFDLSKDAVNLALRESGYGRIVKFGKVEKVKNIPLTGAGKVHYRLLEEMLT